MNMNPASPLVMRSAVGKIIENIKQRPNGLIITSEHLVFVLYFPLMKPAVDPLRDSFCRKLNEYREEIMFNRNEGSDIQSVLQNQFTAYVKKAIHNKRVRYLSCKQKYTYFECSMTVLEPYIVDPRDIFHEFAEIEIIRQALGDIPVKERQIILMRVIEGKSVGEIAEGMGISYRAATSLYYRGMKKLRDRLCGGGDF